MTEATSQSLPSRATRHGTRVFVTAMIALATACGGEAITVGGPPPPPPSAPEPTDGAPVADAATEEVAAPVAAAPVAPTYRDEDFVEGETNRDPFRNFAILFVPRQLQGRQTVQRRVIMDTTSVDEMQLIAIISGVANPSAMLLDQQGTGHTVHRGDYVGRPEYVSTGGADSVPITLNWRVDRISPTEVVLSREDPNSPSQVGLTRVLPLHDATTEGTN